VSALPVDDAAAFLRDVESYFGPCDVTIEFTQEPAVKDALLRAGWTDFDETVWLAHTGDFPPTPDVTIETVSDLEAFARTKLQSFGDTEDEPDASTLANEIASRTAELRGDGRGLVALVDGEVAAMCAYYSGDDYFVFLLGTRLPFRGRGIASAILRRVYEDARASGARSVVINARFGGRPEALYRRLGFCDEVYRQWRFRKPT
jgi:GNAT superfamily N-acetyltransferase